MLHSGATSVDGGGDAVKPKALCRVPPWVFRAWRGAEFMSSVHPGWRGLMQRMLRSLVSIASLTVVRRSDIGAQEPPFDLAGRWHQRAYHASGHGLLASR